MELMEKFCVCVCCAAITMLILVVVCDITRQRCGKCDKCKGVNKMERLTRPTVEVDETAAKYMGSFPVDIRTYKDRLLELILNGPTLNGVSKDALRQIIRQLYGALKAFEDIGLEREIIMEHRFLIAATKNMGALRRLREVAEADKDGRVVVLDEPLLPLIWGDADHDTILCPNCRRDLMGGFELAGSSDVPMFQCPYCGQPIDGTKAKEQEVEKDG